MANYVQNQPFFAWNEISLFVGIRGLRFSFRRPIFQVFELPTVFFIIAKLVFIVFQLMA